MKPAVGQGGLGVRLLKVTDHGWTDLLRAERLSAAVLRDEYQRLVQQQPDCGGILVEEAVGAGAYVPQDWKVYSFRGTTPLVLQVDRNEKVPRYRYYDAAFNPLRGVSASKVEDGTLPAPRHPGALLSLASFISANLPLPFVRVDMYEDAQGPVLGELTPRPGGQRFRPKWDRLLGKYWDSAEAQLRVELGRYHVRVP